MMAEENVPGNDSSDDSEVISDLSTSIGGDKEGDEDLPGVPAADVELNSLEGPQVPVIRLNGPTDELDESAGECSVKIPSTSADAELDANTSNTIDGPAASDDEDEVDHNFDDEGCMVHERDVAGGINEGNGGDQHQQHAPLEASGSVTSTSSLTSIQSLVEFLKRRNEEEIRAGEKSTEPYDYFQLFQAEQRSCAVLSVEVVRGENLSKGSLKDFFDTPDPYVALRVPKTPNGWKITKMCDNTLNPVWDEDFKFFVDLSLPDLFLEIVVYDSNVAKDEVIGKATIPFRPDIEPHVDLTKKIPIKKGFLHLKLLLTPQVKPDLRYSLALCREEKQFLRKRCLRVMNAMRSFIGESHPDAPKSYGEVPIVAVLGSGGGFRAMIGMIGCVKALVHAGIWDCVTYVSALSGSSWFVSALYSLPEFPTDPQVVELLEAELRANVAEKDWRRNLNAKNFMKYARRMAKKRRKGQPVSFTDFFSHLLADTIMPTRKKVLLSDQRAKVVAGGAPFPLYTCLHAKRDVSAAEFHEWLEFTPFEVGMPKYGVFMHTQDFGSKFYIGSIINKYEEPTLTYLQGVWGSAFTILFKRLIAEANKKDEVERVRDKEAGEAPAAPGGSRRPSIASMSDVADADDELLRREMAEHMMVIEEKGQREWSSSGEVPSCSEGEDEDGVIRRRQSSSELANDLREAGHMAVDRLSAIPGKLHTLSRNIGASVMARGSRLVGRTAGTSSLSDDKTADDSRDARDSNNKRTVSALVTMRGDSVTSSCSSKTDPLSSTASEVSSSGDLFSTMSPGLSISDTDASDTDLSDVEDDEAAQFPDFVNIGEAEPDTANGFHQQKSTAETDLEDAADDEVLGAAEVLAQKLEKAVDPEQPAPPSKVSSSATNSPAHHPVSSSSGRKFSLPSWAAAVSWWRSSEEKEEAATSSPANGVDQQAEIKPQQMNNGRKLTVVSEPGDVGRDPSPGPPSSSGRGKFFSSPMRQRSKPKTFVRKNATRSFQGEHGRDYWKVQKFKQKEQKTRSFWASVGMRILQSKTFDTRTARAGQIFNPLRGLKLEHRFPISPFAQLEDDSSMVNLAMSGSSNGAKEGTPSGASTLHVNDDSNGSEKPGDDETDGIFKGIKEAYDTAVKRIYLVDSGLAFNSPYPLVLRPQRGVDLFISFDFSGRRGDNVPPFKELILSEKWARQNHVPFPPIEEQVKVFVKEPVREFYVFKDESDPNCPTVVHIVLHNGRHRDYDLEGKERASRADREFCDFPIFSDPQNPYSTFNFHYTPLAFDRLVDLMYYNTRYAADAIREELASAVRIKRRQVNAPVRNIRDLANFKYSFRDDGSDRLKQLAEQFRNASLKGGKGQSGASRKHQRRC